MTEKEIFERVEKFVEENMKGVPFDKGLPILRNFVWDLGESIGITGVEVMRIYFDKKSSMIK